MILATRTTLTHLVWEQQMSRAGGETSHGTQQGKQTHLSHSHTQNQPHACSVDHFQHHTLYWKQYMHQMRSIV